MGYDHIACDHCKVAYNVEDGQATWLADFLADHTHGGTEFHGVYQGIGSVGPLRYVKGFPLERYPDDALNAKGYRAIHDCHVIWSRQSHPEEPERRAAERAGPSYVWKYLEPPFFHHAFEAMQGHCWYVRDWHYRDRGLRGRMLLFKAWVYLTAPLVPLGSEKNAKRWPWPLLITIERHIFHMRVGGAG